MQEFLNNLPPGDAAIEAHIWEYIDGVSSEEEKSAIENLIAENAEWRAKYSELLQLHQMIHSSELEEPSMRFTKNVMDQLSRLHIAPAAKNYINKKVIWGLGAFFMTTILAFLIYGFAQVDWSTGNSGSFQRIDFSEVDYSRMFNNTYLNIFMMFNIVLGLIVLDKFLANKRNKLMKES